jgi:hypothetical protein
VRDSISITCPYCGEASSIAFDASEGGSEFITDCEVCCRPMTVAVRTEDGEITGVDITPA